MFGATFLVPLLTGFPPATTLFFSAIGTAAFLLITRGRVPSYLGSSFAFLAPMGVGSAAGQLPMPVALGGILDRKSTRLNSSHVAISYAVFCLKKKNTRTADR